MNDPRASNAGMNIYGASHICMNIHGASNICMNIYGASNTCMNIYRASNIRMKICGYLTHACLQILKEGYCIDIYLYIYTSMYVLIYMYEAQPSCQRRWRSQTQACTYHGLYPAHKTEEIPHKQQVSTQDPLKTTGDSLT